MSGGRHKVFGHPALHIIPQTSTIASHLPRAVGLGFALGLAKAPGRDTPWPEDAVVVCSFGDASANHSTATGALNAAAYLAHRAATARCCSSARTTASASAPVRRAGWTGGGAPAAPRHRVPPRRRCRPAVELLAAIEEALAGVRSRRSPAVLHLSTVRFMGHAGSDVEIAYRSQARDPGRLRARPAARARRVPSSSAASLAPAEVLERYEQVRTEVMDRLARRSAGRSA